VEDNVGSVGSDYSLFCPALVSFPMRRGFGKFHPVDYYSRVSWSDFNGDYVPIQAVAERGRKSDLTGNFQGFHRCFTHLPRVDIRGNKDGQAKDQREKVKLSHFGSHLLSAHSKGIGLEKSNL